MRATRWLVAPRLTLQRASAAGSFYSVRIESDAVSGSDRFAVWKKYGNKWAFAVQSGSQGEFSLQPDPLLGRPDAVVVSRVNRLGIESARSHLQLQP